jgi:hypothetical protein
MGVEAQRHVQATFHWEKTTLHSDEITHKIKKNTD